jgi:hypothetical protein
MSLKTRRFLYISFIIIFLIITPIISLYAAGYKIGSGFLFQKTGVFIIDSEPPGAKIYIDGKIKKNFFQSVFRKEDGFIRTPAKLKNILPGEYNIKVELDEYWPWEKIKKINIPKTASSSAEYQWSADGQKIIINKNVYNIDNEKIESLEKIIGSGISNIKWDNINNDKIYYKYNGNINTYSLSKQTNEIIIKNKEILDFLPKNDYLYYTVQENNSIILNTWNISRKEVISKLNLPLSPYTFLNPEHKLINLYDPSHHILYLIDPLSEIKPLRETISNVEKTVWVNENKLLYANGFEIRILDMNTLDKTLLTRISQKIRSIIWHPNNNNVIYSTDSNINILELDNREKYNITKLIELNEIDNLILNEKGDALYFYARIGNQEGLYKLFIQ